MDLNNKVYGYTIALWELGKTVPSLFRKLSDYKLRKHIPTTTIWTAMIDPSWAPLPIRRLILPWLRNRDARGNLWNMCHFWSNFEIADMDFFRSREYRDLFQLLDQDGGFYYERWGDAPVHSLAAAMLLKAEQLHHFSDVGYVHSNLQYCAYESKKEAFERGVLVPGRKEERGPMLGCNCKCDEGIEVIGSTCFNRIRSTVM
jgi:mannosyltransferase